MFGAIATQLLFLHGHVATPQALAALAPRDGMDASAEVPTKADTKETTPGAVAPAPALSIRLRVA